MAAGAEECVLFYPPVVGRGEFVRLIFEELGVPFGQVTDFQRVLSYCRGNERDRFPSFAMPLIREGESRDVLGSVVDAMGLVSTLQNASQWQRFRIPPGVTVLNRLIR